MTPSLAEATAAARRIQAGYEDWPLTRMAADAKVLAGFVLAGDTERLRAALNCEHNHNGDTGRTEVLWEYVEHEGETWSRCKACGLLELWADGMFVRAALAEGGV